MHVWVGPMHVCVCQWIQPSYVISLLSYIVYFSEEICELVIISDIILFTLT